MKAVRGYAVMSQGCGKRGLMGVLGVNVFGKVGSALKHFITHRDGAMGPTINIHSDWFG